MQTIQAGSNAWLLIEFFDKDGNAVIPVSVTYAVHCQTTGTVVRATTALVAAAQIEIPLVNPDTVLQDAVTNSAEVNITDINATGLNEYGMKPFETGSGELHL